MAQRDTSVSQSDDNSSSDQKKKPWQSYHTVYTNAKAGMEGVDKEKVQRIVYEMSKGSKYFENEERKEADMKKKIENMRTRYAKLTPEDLSHYQKIADKRVVELEAGRDLSRIWLHVDMDAFYAAVETLCNPSLKGKPMAVGGMSMLSTANYEARKFGVRAAMPGFIARKLCPELIFVPVDFKKYTHYSDLTRKVFQKYDSNFMAASLDEAYLDITNVCLERGITGGEVAEELRINVYNETGLTCSAGVAPNRLLAKVCSDINKPNGQFVLPSDRMAVMTFISSLPIRKIGGIGKVTDQILKNVFEITTCEEMLQKRAFLCALFSHSSSDFFLSVALGLGGTDTPESKFRKSISNERTFAATDDETLLNKKINKVEAENCTELILVDLSEMLAADMRKECLSGKTLTLKLKTASFEVRTRAVTLPNFISSYEDILKHASKLLKAELPLSLRLMGLRMSQFNDDKNGVRSDPTQRTLSNFIIPRDSCRRYINYSTPVGSDISDTTTNSFVEFPTDSSERCDLRNSDCYTPFSDSAQKEDIRQQVGSSLRCRSDESREKTNHLDVEGETGLLRPCRNGDSSLLEYDLGNSPTLEMIEDLEAGPSTNKNGSFYWVEDYKCSLCGVELPPSFIEERQEHSDFHFAERLQEEESGDNRSSIPLNHRLIQRERNVSPSNPRKKQKSPAPIGKHVPIDVYFAKTSQNF